LDPKHAFHKRAHTWWASNEKLGWASCPLTENAVVRIMSHPNYDPPYRFSVCSVIGQLRDFTQKTDHLFWADEISLLDDSLFDPARIHGPKQLTDLYLLALATKHTGRLVTFDQGIPLSAVKTAEGKNLFVA
jgi:predicted nucleic acid-binding protein